MVLAKHTGVWLSITMAKKSKHQVIKKTLYDYGEKKMNYFYIFEIQYEHSTLVL